MRFNALVTPLAAALLTACASAPPPPEPAARRQLLDIEQQGAKRYAHGDYAGAVLRFNDATRLATSIDDADGATRNRLHAARTLLAAGDPAAAVALAAPLRGDPLHAIDVLYLLALAALERGDLAAASGPLSDAAGRCAKTCAQAASLDLLAARAALAAGDNDTALASAQRAQARLTGADDRLELANAWRLAARAELARGQRPAARNAARQALELDRHLALPEKIARDWLLLASASDGEEAQAAYRRAAAVAEAAGLTDIAASARRALPKETPP